VGSRQQKNQFSEITCSRLQLPGCQQEHRTTAEAAAVLLTSRKLSAILFGLPLSDPLQGLQGTLLPCFPTLKETS
jgi:hypothetical protein